MSVKKISSLSQIKSKAADPERLSVLKSVDPSDLAKSAIFNELTHQAAIMFNAPVALISLVDKDFDYILGQIGIPEPYATTRIIDAQPSFCALTIAQSEPLVIDDTANHPTLRLFPSVQIMGVRAHLGIPLCYNGQSIGNCCVIDYKPRHWTAEDVKNLSNLARSAMKHIHNYSSSQTSLL